jgi:hypothetical protein
MIRSIIKKEWLKLKFYFLAMVSVVFAVLGHFWFNLDFSFSTIEPESMMWYKFAHLEDKPYFYLSYLFLVIGVVVSLAQFIPERVQKRIKIMAHLPLNLRDALFMHLFIGISFIAVLTTIFSIGLLSILINYYPKEIINIALKDTLFYTFASMVLYIGLSAVILETKHLVAFFKFTLVAIFIFVFLKTQFLVDDLVWGLFLVFIPFLTLDSFYNIKEQRLESVIFRSSLVVAVIALLYTSYLSYSQNYKYSFNKYYIFYSNIINDFVYQKNFGNHQFEYGIKDKKTFSQIEYESYLPFVYWRNVDIQKKLPISINGVDYDKKIIKSSRLGFSYNPSMLKELEVKLFPLLNPQSKKGMIKFPEEVFTIDKKGVKIYDFDNRLLKDQVNDLSQKLKSNGFEYPAVNIWGKSINMKPFDKGYLVQDIKNDLYNIKRVDDLTTVKKVKYPEDIDLAFIKLSENKAKVLSGYAIDKNSNFYLLTWDFKFIKLELEKFDYKKMKLKLISNPLNYLIRYDDGKNYYATVFLKK